MCRSKIILIKILLSLFILKTFGGLTDIDLNCKKADEHCNQNRDCCSKICDDYDTRNFCRDSGFKHCGGEGMLCVSHDQCCSRRCKMRHYRDGICYGKEPSTATCKKDGEDCQKALDCCSKVCRMDDDEEYKCIGSAYVPCIPSSGKSSKCVRDIDCCSRNCYFPNYDEAYCQGPHINGTEKCRPYYDACEDSIQCCVGRCDKIDGIMFCNPTQTSNIFSGFTKRFSFG